MTKLKRIESEEEYWIKHKEYKKKLNVLFRKSFKYIGRPHDFAVAYDKVLDEMEFIGLVSPEWCMQQRTRFYDMLKSPDLKGWIQENIDLFKQKVKHEKK